MPSMLHRARPDSPVDQWSNETSDVAKLRPVNLDLKKTWPRPSPRKRRSRPLVRFLITFCIGVAATLAWQSFGEQVRQMAANSSPVLGWLATEPTTPSPDLPQLKILGSVMRTEKLGVGPEC